MAALEAKTGRRGDVRSFHRRKISSRNQISSLAAGQGAPSMHDGPGRTDARRSFAQPPEILTMTLRRSIPPTNADLAELFANEAESASSHLQRAFRRAARRAFLWPVEAAELLVQGRSLTELAGLRPYLAQ